MRNIPFASNQGETISGHPTAAKSFPSLDEDFDKSFNKSFDKGLYKGFNKKSNYQYSIDFPRLPGEVQKFIWEAYVQERASRGERLQLIQVCLTKSSNRPSYRVECLPVIHVSKLHRPEIATAISTCAIYVADLFLLRQRVSNLPNFYQKIQSMSIKQSQDIRNIHFTSYGLSHSDISALLEFVRVFLGEWPLRRGKASAQVLQYTKTLLSILSTTLSLRPMFHRTWYPKAAATQPRSLRDPHYH